MLNRLFYLNGGSQILVSRQSGSAQYILFLPLKDCSFFLMADPPPASVTCILVDPKFSHYIPLKAAGQASASAAKCITLCNARKCAICFLDLGWGVLHTPLLNRLLQALTRILRDVCLTQDY